MDKSDFAFSPPLSPAFEVSALTVTLMAVLPYEAIASGRLADSGPRGGHETLMDPGLAKGVDDDRPFVGVGRLGRRLLGLARRSMKSREPAPSAAAN